MLCENCKQETASVLITEIKHSSSENVQRHFCESCAKLFQQSDVIHAFFRRLAMIKFRVAAASPERTLVNVVGGRHDGETWSFVTERLRQFQIDPSDGLEFEFEEDETYIGWLKGKQPPV